MESTLLLFFAVVAAAFGLGPASYLRARARRVRAFRDRVPQRALGFGEVVWGRPDLDGRDVVLVAQLAVGLVTGALLVANVTAGFLLVGPEVTMTNFGVVLPSAVVALALQYATRRLQRVPRLHRLRFTQQGIRSDFVLVGLDPASDETLLEGRPSRRGRTVEMIWEEVQLLDRYGDHLVICAEDGVEIHYGPIPTGTADEILREGRARLYAKAGDATGADRMRLERLRQGQPTQR